MKIEEVVINGINLIKTTATEGYELHKVGTDEVYEEAYDFPKRKFEYIEVKKPEEVFDEQQPNDIGE